MHALDNPVWQSLTTQHANLALPRAPAARYPAAIAPFGAVDADAARAGNQLTSLVNDGEAVYLVGIAPPAPPGWVIEPKKPIVQMICDALPEELPGPDAIAMTPAQSDDMLALTALVFPGSSVRARSRWASISASIMATGSRPWPENACGSTASRNERGVHASDYTGRGYAQRLLSLLCRRSFERGFTPFLHVYADNARAIGVYRRLGFADRKLLPLWLLHEEGVA